MALACKELLGVFFNNAPAVKVSKKINIHPESMLIAQTMGNLQRARGAGEQNTAAAATTAGRAPHRLRRGEERTPGMGRGRGAGFSPVWRGDGALPGGPMIKESA